MAEVDADLKPILEMFTVQLRHPNVTSTLKDWRGTLSKGVLHFGRRETLDKDLEFNTLIYTELHPTASRSGRRITLEPQLDLVGVVTSRTMAHKEFHFLKNELIILRARGRWDYAKNDGPYDLTIAPDVTVRMPGNSDRTPRAASRRMLKEVGKLCFSWLVVNRLSAGNA